MSDLNSKMFVNLGASQTRHRLKGFGHGVRKVETAGSNNAVIVHTATGQHLRQLQAKFANVGFSETENQSSNFGSMEYSPNNLARSRCLPLPKESR